MEWGARGELLAPRQVNYSSSFCDGDRRTWGRWASRNMEDHLWENFRSFAPGIFGYEWMVEKLWGRAIPKGRPALPGRPCRLLLLFLFFTDVLLLLIFFLLTSLFCFAVVHQALPPPESSVLNLVFLIIRSELIVERGTLL